MILNGASCSATLTAETITISGEYYYYIDHKRCKTSGVVTVKTNSVLRVGLTKTYSRLMLLFPMCFGVAALLIRSIPSIGYEKEIIRDVYSVGITLWNVPFQEVAWKLCAVLCLITIPMYWLSYRNDLEVNTTQGRYLLPRKGMDAAQIASFQREFTKMKSARRKTVERT